MDLTDRGGFEQMFVGQSRLFLRTSSLGYIGQKGGKAKQKHMAAYLPLTFRRAEPLHTSHYDGTAQTHEDTQVLSQSFQSKIRDLGKT